MSPELIKIELPFSNDPFTSSVLLWRGERATLCPRTPKTMALEGEASSKRVSRDRMVDERLPSFIVRGYDVDGSGIVS